jgi:hypothetical protein
MAAGYLHLRSNLLPTTQPRFGRAVDTVINPHRRNSARPLIQPGDTVSGASGASDPGQSLDGLIFLARLLRGQG